MKYEIMKHLARNWTVLSVGKLKSRIAGVILSLSADFHYYFALEAIRLAEKQV